MTAIPLGPAELAGAASLVLINGLLSVWLGLDLHKRLAIASVRTVVQLLLLGLILTPVFRWSSPWAVVGLCAVMVTLAAWESTRRSSRLYRGILASTFAAMLVGAGGTAIVATVALVGADPWYDPRYMIPFVGMVLGNALTGVTLGLDRCLTSLDKLRSQVEIRLAWGATWWEAARPITSDAVKTGMIPIINSMSVVGLITIPGMTTGQLLGGASPEQAVRYQILILFVIAAATGLGTVIAVLMSVRALFDRDHRLRPERIRLRP